MRSHYLKSDAATDSSSHSSINKLPFFDDTKARLNPVEVSAPFQVTYSVQEWLLNLMHDPNYKNEKIKQALETIEHTPEYFSLLVNSFHCVPLEPISETSRFKDELWHAWPFNLYSQLFLKNKQWLTQAFKKLPGANQHQLNIINFIMIQCLECASPANFLMTNPLMIKQTIMKGGNNLRNGYANLVDDVYRLFLKLPPKGAEKFKVGCNVAVTKGSVVMRNELMELLQYHPTTRKVKAQPILIIPAWIMKYYILDLSPENSLIKYLVDQGFTVFTISWKNPTSSDRSLGMEDFLNLGILSSIDCIHKIIKNQLIHTVGYCLGGTLLSMATAKLAKDKKKRIASMSLLAAQTDFSEPGDIGIFIDKYQIKLIESLMRSSGFMDSAQMSGAFQLIGAADRKWSQITKEYLLGERSELNDLMAWNADGTRLPCHMHSEYLNHMYLNNDLAMGNYKIDSKPISLGDIEVPTFAIGMKQDFVAPWKSVYKLHHYLHGDLEFVLGSGGHNAGIVNPPNSDHTGSFQHLLRTKGDTTLSPDAWLKKANVEQGSWWPFWVNWLDNHSSGEVDAPKLTASSAPKNHCVEAAPGTYVLQ